MNISVNKATLSLRDNDMDNTSGGSQIHTGSICSQWIDKRNFHG